MKDLKMVYKKLSKAIHDKENLRKGLEKKEREIEELQNQKMKLEGLNEKI